MKVVIKTCLTILLLIPFSGCKKLDLIKSEVPPVVVPAESIRFAVIGDYGQAGEPERQVAEMVKGWNPDFIITTGDNNYSKGEECTLNENIGQYYCDYIYNYDAPDDQKCNGKATQEMQNRFFPSTGNHDFNIRNKDVPYLNYFTLPGAEEYYEFIWGPVHFFSLSSGKTGNPLLDSYDQFYWLRDKLASSDSPWNLVYFHHSTYSSGEHGSDFHMQWPFEEWGASAVLSGHDHIYSRILKKNSTLPYFINGLGGNASRYGCNDNPLDPKEFDVFCYNENNGAMLVTADSSEITFKFFSISNPNIPVDTYVLRVH